VRNIGPLSRFDDGEPDFIKRLRRSFKEGNPLIPSLADLVDPNRIPKRLLSFTLDPDDKNERFCAPKNIGYFILDGLYDGLGIYDVLNLHKSRSKIEYDLNGLTKLLVFGRTLDPCSKKATHAQKDKYLFDVTDSDNLIHLYRALDALNAKSDAIQRRMNLKISRGIGRNTEVCFYDVTNHPTTTSSGGMREDPIRVR
jgi:hypothetical protein